MKDLLDTLRRCLILLIQCDTNSLTNKPTSGSIHKRTLYNSYQEMSRIMRNELFLHTIPQPRPLDQGLYHKTIIYNTPTKTTGPRFISQDYLIIIYLNNIKYTLGEPFKKSYQEMSRIMRNELHLKSI